MNILCAGELRWAINYVKNHIPTDTSYRLKEIIINIIYKTGRIIITYICQEIKEVKYVWLDTVRFYLYRIQCLLSSVLTTQINYYSYTYIAAIIWHIQVTTLLDCNLEIKRMFDLALIKHFSKYNVRVKVTNK